MTKTMCKLLLVRKRSPAARREGLTLLETILALAILGISMAIIGELIRVGARNAAAARDLTNAQILAESTMSEIVAGIIPAEAVEGVPCEFDPEWVYSVTITPVDQQGLISVNVIVQQDRDPAERPALFSLTRWMPDPTLELDAASMEEAAAATTSANTGF